ncbi:MAG: hypothetical protein Kow00127_05470 [Bacteroidales bacterium]
MIEQVQKSANNSGSDVEKLNISVLFVEDEELLRAIYQRILGRVVERLYVATNGKEGLEAYQRYKPDLIITDIMMPVMDGLEMVQEIRKSDKDIRLVILSAYGETEYFMDAIKIGVNSFLLKPVETKKLIELVEELANGILLARKVKEEELQRRIAEENLRKLNLELEERVRERTRELEKEIRERIQAEEELKKLNQTLELRVKEELRKRERQQQLLIQKSKLESIGELAAGMAHEINQPLGGLSMGLDNILFKLTQDELDEEYLKKKIDAMFEDIDRIKNIINHVRVFSRDQANPIDETINVNEVITNALSLISRQYANHNVDVALDLQENIGAIMGNGHRLEQVFLNLLSNAKYAVERREQLSGPGFKKRIEIRTRTKDGIVIAEVMDNGIGIPEEHLDNVFDPFFTTKNVEDGTGLGLSISYGIIKEMKGTISVESRENEFTLMRIELPMVEKAD